MHSDQQNLSYHIIGLSATEDIDRIIDITTRPKYNETRKAVGCMQISSRFTLAIHIFACIDTFEKEYKVTSDFLAGSTNVNPVVIRKILGQLKAA